ncbi:MAG: alpha/beta fold hydrolase [Anaerolineales bacterium]
MPVPASQDSTAGIRRRALAGGAQLALALLLALAGCGPSPLPAPAVLAATWTPTPISTASLTATPSPTRTATVSPVPAATATPDPYAGLTIADLAGREYGQGKLVVDETSRPVAAFERQVFHYPSDDLTVYGFMDIPVGPGPYPVVLVLHGYVSPQGYQTLTYTTRYADELAKAGFLVLHPNYRDYPPSDIGPNPFRIGFAIDALNLIALVRRTGGESGSLEKADPAAIGLFGHSMGGGIALRVITVDPAVQAAVLYGAMSGDERLNFEKIVEWSGGRAGWEELNASAADLARISPIDHLDRIEAAVSIHHGEDDQTVPPEWSADLCQRLTDLGKSVECSSYPGMPHTFYGDSERELLDSSVEFFNRNLR